MRMRIEGSYTTCRHRMAIHGPSSRSISVSLHRELAAALPSALLDRSWRDRMVDPVDGEADCEWPSCRGPTTRSVLCRALSGTMVGSGHLLAQIDVRPMKLMGLRGAAQQSLVGLVCGPAVTIRPGGKRLADSGRRFVAPPRLGERTFVVVIAPSSKVSPKDRPSSMTTL